MSRTRSQNVVIVAGLAASALFVYLALRNVDERARREACGDLSSGGPCTPYFFGSAALAVADGLTDALTETDALGITGAGVLTVACAAGASS